MTSGRKPTNIEIERWNRASVFQHFFRCEHATKQDLVNELGLCLPTVSKNLRALTDAGLIGISGSVGNTGGRRARTWSLCANARAALGLDITLRHLTVVAVNLRGEIIASSRARLDFQPGAEYYHQAAGMLEALVHDAELRPEQILGAGIGLPALVDKDGKSLIFSKILPLSAAIHADLSAHIPYPVRLYNDANAAAFAESWASPSQRSMFYLMLSNNVGGALILDGQYYPGSTQKGSEVGHITLVPGGRECYCGQRGCTDAYLSATNLSAHADGDLHAFFARLSSGESGVLSVWDEYLNDLAMAVNSVHALLDCDIVIGGYVGEHLEPYLSALRDKAAARSTFGEGADYVKLCSYRRESIAAGAALHFIDAFIREI